MGMVVLILSFTAIFDCSIAAAQGTMKPQIPPRAREIAMALSAAPTHLRDGAAVYALDSSGFVRVRGSTNGFSCIVNRDHPLALKPTCYDAEGSRTILPRVLQVGAWLMQGKSVSEIAELVRAGFSSGRFESPRRPGVAYMLSGEIRNFNVRTGTTEAFPPHVMFYAPGLTDSDIGSNGGSDGLPFIAYQGPQGFMIMMAPRDTEDPVAITQAPTHAGRRTLFKRDEEIALARSAAPPAVSAGARILVFDDTGYVLAVPGTTSVTCVVNRSWPESVEPHCYDAEASATVLLIELRRNVMRHQGHGEQEIDREIADGLASGRFRLPHRPAMSYMMSEAQILFDDDGKRVGKWRPHLMIYYPYLTSAELGMGGGEPDMRVGMVSDEGRPTATLVIPLAQFVPLTTTPPR